MESSDLSEPLLQPTKPSAMTLDDQEPKWSDAIADVAMLYVPTEWKLTDVEPICKLRYDEERELLLVVGAQIDSSEEVVLDILDPSDIIGSNLQLCFLDQDNDLVDPSSRRVGFRNEKAKIVNLAMDKEAAGSSGIVEDEQEKKTAGEEAGDASRCNIFGALKDDVERVFEWDRACANGDDIPYDSQATAYLHIYCYPRRRPTQEGWLSWCGLTSHRQLRVQEPPPPVEIEKLGNRYPHFRHFEVVPRKGFEEITALVRHVRRVANLRRRGRYLVVVNPASGRKKARMVYETILKPMLGQASLEHDVCITTHAGHAEERMHEGEEGDVSMYDGLIAMGGDGVLAEMANGLRNRDDVNEVLAHMTFGVVGCGTSNGLAKSILHECKESYGWLESCFVICKGHSRRMDLSTYQVQDKTYTGFLTFSWAFIADIDIESECIRFCGDFRNDIWAVWCILKKRVYRGRFSYLPASKVKDKSKVQENLPALTDPIPDDWETIEDDFILFWAAQVSHAGVRVYNSPQSSLNDGVFQVFIVRAPISRLKLALLSLGFDNGSHINRPECEFIECVAYRLEPLSEGSFNVLDGEVIETGPVQGHVKPAEIALCCG